MAKRMRTTIVGAVNVKLIMKEAVASQMYTPSSMGNLRQPASLLTKVVTSELEHVVYSWQNISLTKIQPEVESS